MWYKPHKKQKSNCDIKQIIVHHISDEIAMTNLFIYIFAISKQAGSVQLIAGLNGGLYNQSKGSVRPHHWELYSYSLQELGELFNIPC